MITYKSNHFVILIVLCIQTLVLRGIETDSLCIDPDQPVTTDDVQVRSYVTIPNCCAGIDSVDIHTNLDEYYWEQTQCSDPWHTGISDPNEETYDSLLFFFSRLGVELHRIRFVYDPELAEDCEACNCRSGTVIYTYTIHNDTTVLSETGFKRGADTLFDIVRSYHPEHYPQCDCYCQCADTIDIGTLETGSHRLLFTMVFIDTIVPAIYNAYDSIDYTVTGAAEIDPYTKTYDVFILYPNPSSDYVHVSENLVGCRYKLIDFSGRIMMEDILQQNFFSIRNMLPGIYSVRFYKEDQTITTLRLIINSGTNQ